MCVLEVTKGYFLDCGFVYDWWFLLLSGYFKIRNNKRMIARECSGELADGVLLL